MRHVQYVYCLFSFSVSLSFMCLLCYEFSQYFNRSRRLEEYGKLRFMIVCQSAHFTFMWFSIQAIPGRQTAVHLLFAYGSRFFREVWHSTNRQEKRSSIGVLTKSNQIQTEFKVHHFLLGYDVESSR